MTTVLLTPIGFVTLTFCAYGIARLVYRKSRFFLFHPVLMAIVILIMILKAGGVPYEEYKKGGDLITIFLGPAVVAIGVPLYRELDKIRRQLGAILLTTIFGSLIGIVSAVIPAMIAGASKEVIISLAPKSVTTPIAMAISGALGGLPPLSAVIVISSGILGAVIGPTVLGFLGVTSRSAFGLAMGFSAHGIGTARALEIGEEEGSFSGLGLCLNGIMTAVFTPIIVGWLV